MPKRRFEILHFGEHAVFFCIAYFAFCTSRFWKIPIIYQFRRVEFQSRLLINDLLGLPELVKLIKARFKIFPATAWFTQFFTCHVDYCPAFKEDFITRKQKS